MKNFRLIIILIFLSCSKNGTQNMEARQRMLFNNLRISLPATTHSSTFIIYSHLCSTCTKESLHNAIRLAKNTEINYFIFSGSDTILVNNFTEDLSTINHQIFSFKLNEIEQSGLLKAESIYIKNDNVKIIEWGNL